jgi:hypothetical protein
MTIQDLLVLPAIPDLQHLQMDYHPWNRFFGIPPPWFPGNWTRDVCVPNLCISVSMLIWSIDSENPFNYDLNDLDLDYFCLAIQRELHLITAVSTFVFLALTPAYPRVSTAHDAQPIRLYLQLTVSAIPPCSPCLRSIAHHRNLT